MNTPSHINLTITSSNCYYRSLTEGELFTKEDLAKETGRQEDVIGNELREMCDLGKLITFTVHQELTRYKVPDPDLGKMAKASWRTKTNREIGCKPHDCWAVI